jgi:[acyl-carrier-protein] S-malonyltransferase
MKYKHVSFIFPGQGAQYCGMGKDFYEAFAVCRETFEEADHLLNRHLSNIVFQGPEELLTETRNSQTGIYVMSMALLRVLNQQFPQLTPKICGGLSLGEYTAVTAAGKLAFKDCLPLVQFRGEYMNDACIRNKGTMAVVMGMDSDAVESMVAQLNLPHDLWVANLNCPGQVVISGTLKGIEAGTQAAKAKGAKRVLPLQVHGAFHSGLMAEAEDRLRDKVGAAPFQESGVELVMNVTGKPVKKIDEIRDLLVKQVTNPVRWEESVRSMESAGTDLYIEIGCGKTLTGMNKRIGIAAPCLSIEKVEDLEQLAGVLS